MSNLTLVIGNKNYSSWSLRPWLVLKQFGLPFEEIRIPLRQAQTMPALLQHSAAGKVPVLHDGATTVWDSLAICEYLAERFPEAGLWPRSTAARAHARSVCAEMHSSFTALREHMTMNARGSFPGRGLTPEVVTDIQRIQAIWRECRDGYGKEGPFLYGTFSIADAFYAPVVLRFNTYAPPLDENALAYCKTLLALPALQTWIADSRAEPETLDVYELYR